MPDALQNRAPAAQPPDCLQNAERVSIPSGARLFQSGDVCQQFVYLLDGSIRVDLISQTGKTILLYRFGPGQTCILTTSCLISGDSYCAEAHTEQEVIACVLAKPDFDRLMDGSQEFREIVFSSFSLRLAAMMEKVEDIAFIPINSRLAARVLELAALDNRLEITHEELAVDLGTAREVVSRKLGLWEKQGLIRRRRGILEILDLDEIQQFAKLRD